MYKLIIENKHGGITPPVDMRNTHTNYGNYLNILRSVYEQYTKISAYCIIIKDKIYKGFKSHPKSKNSKH